MIVHTTTSFPLEVVVFLLERMCEIMTLEQLINDNAKKLNESDEYVLKFIRQNMEISIQATVAEIAERVNISDSTIIRLAKKLGFSGYGEFRYFLREEQERIKQTSIFNNDFFQTSVLLNDVNSTIKLFENDRSMEEIYLLMNQANRIFIYATGYGQGLMVQEFVRCMWNAGVYVITVPEKNELNLISEDISKNDLLFVVSLSGNSKKIDPILKRIQLKGSEIISITNFTRNELASKANKSVYYQVTNVNKVSQLNNSSFCTLNLVLSLLYEGYMNYQKQLKS